MKGNMYRAAELHSLAAHAHQSAAVHHGKGDHETGSEHSRQAMEHSAKAFLQSLAADRSSAKLAGAGKTKPSDTPAKSSRVSRQGGK
jgi:hypothetical protein